ncbi:ABC transporter substrate-binding protein [Candidatus Gracilibacteria bacterium]|nr:ABC transporter substrate-binding protein [Candidatus Gracilibacteria bacterium]
MRSLLRQCTLLMLVVFLGVTAAACGTQQGAATDGQGTSGTATGGTDGQGTSGTATGGTSAVAGLPAECSNVQLEYWNPFSGPDGPFMGELAERFGAETGVQVAMTSINNNNPPGGYYTRLATSQASNLLPDVAIIHADQVATQAFRNVIRPMDDLVSEMGIDGGDFPEAVWNAGEVAGSRYAIPLDIHPMTMFYNQEALQQAGLSGPPTNAEEFEQAAQTATNDETFGFMLTTGFPIQQIFQQMLHQFGGSEFNEDGTEATWNSEAGVQALQWMKNAQEQYGEPNLEVDAELNAFRSGGVGMIWNGIWQTADMTGEGVEFQSGATAVPQIGPQPAVWAGSHQLALPAQSNPDPCKEAAAALFIRYLIDNSVEWARAGQIPASNNVRASEEFLAIEPQAAIAPSVESAFFPPSVPGITDAFLPMAEAVGAVMSGNAPDIQAALDDSVARANQILEQNRQNFGEAPSQ